MMNLIQQYILNNWESMGIHGSKPKKLSSIQISMGQGKRYDKGRLVHLIFRDDESKPFIVAKFCRSEEYEYHLKRESEICNILREKYNLSYPPRQIYQTVIGKKLVNFEEFIDGTSFKISLDNSVVSSNYSSESLQKIIEQHFEQTSQIIYHLNSYAEKTDRKHIEDELDAVIKHFKGYYAGNKEFIELIDKEVSSIFEILPQEAFRRIVNFDFIPQNIICNRDRVRVIDWEFSDLSTLLFLEPLRFLYYYLWELMNLKVFKVDDFAANFAYLTKSDSEGWLINLIREFYSENNLYKLPLEKGLLMLLIFEADLQFRTTNYLEYTKKYHLNLITQFIICISTIEIGSIEFKSGIEKRIEILRKLDENTQINSLNKVIQDKDTHIRNLESTIDALNKAIYGKDIEIKNLESTIDALNKTIYDKDVHIRNITAILNKIHESKSRNFIQSVPMFNIELSNFIKIGMSGYRILLTGGHRSLIEEIIWHSKYGKFNYGKNLKESYDTYIIKHTDIKKMRNQLKSFKYKPQISIITPVYNVDEIWLEKAIYSVINQVYENWELCLVDDASTKMHIRKVLEKHAKHNYRIKVKYLKENLGISGASNEALSLATGEFIGLLDHDDELPINALFEVVKLLQEHPEADMIYSDENKIDINGKRSEPYFKPDWSPDLFLSNMYTCHFGVYRKKIIDEIGGFRKGYEGSQDYDLVLRFAERTDKIYHIPKILYHWRKIPNSTAVRYEAKGYADTNARKALEDSLERRKINGEVLLGKFPSSFRIKRDIIGTPRVSIIIPTKDHIDVLRKCIESIEKKTSYKNYEIIIIDNNSKDHQTIDYLETISKAPNIRTLKYEDSFNFSAINNFTARNSNGEYLLFLNNDTEVISDEWLSAMLEHSQRKEVGAVGGMLLYPNGTIQHAGVIIGLGGVAGHSHKYIPKDNPGYMLRPHLVHNLSAVTAACMMLRKDVFEEVGGFDENLAVAFNDVDLCLKIREKGYLIVYTPYAELYHHESLSRGYEDNPEKQKRFLKEVKYIREKWKQVINKGDPYYNPNLTLEREDFSIRI